MARQHQRESHPAERYIDFHTSLVWVLNIKLLKSSYFLNFIYKVGWKGVSIDSEITPQFPFLLLTTITPFEPRNPYEPASGPFNTRIDFTSAGVMALDKF